MRGESHTLHGVNNWVSKFWRSVESASHAKLSMMFFSISVQSGEQRWSGGRISAGYLRTCVDAWPISRKGVAPQGDNIRQHRSQSNPLNPHHHPRRVLHLQKT